MSTQPGKVLRIATRGSALALWQAEHVRARLQALEPGLSVELVVLKTRGDKIVDRPLSEVGGKGLFVKEIEEALLDGRAEIAVHSLKDLTAGIPAELWLGAFPEREDPRDALLLAPSLRSRQPAVDSIRTLPQHARVGTSSLRRVCQLKAARPDLSIFALRGNVDTRLGKVDAAEFDAIVLACAGLRRLGYGARIDVSLSVEESLPAVGQGALALECRADDAHARSLLLGLDHRPTRLCIEAERGFLAELDGDCKTPLGAYATLDGDTLHIEGLLGEPDGSRVIRQALAGPASDGPTLGRKLAAQLLRAFHA